MAGDGPALPGASPPAPAALLRRAVFRRSRRPTRCGLARRGGLGLVEAGPQGAVLRLELVDRARSGDRCRSFVSASMPPNYHPPHSEEPPARACLAIAVVHTMEWTNHHFDPRTTLTQLRHALSDDHYAIIEPLLPTNDRPGHPWKGHRSVIDGILWILHTGAPWRDLPRDDLRPLADRLRAVQPLEQGRHLGPAPGGPPRPARRRPARSTGTCSASTAARSGLAGPPPGPRRPTGRPPSRPTTPWAARAAGSARRSTWSATARACRWR